MSRPCDKTFVLVPTSRSSVKVKVKCQGHSFQKKKKKWPLRKIGVAQTFLAFFPSGRVENSVGEKRENADNHHFLLSPQCFKNASYMGVV